MIIRKIIFLLIGAFQVSRSLYAVSLIEQFEQAGYVEVYNSKHIPETFKELYAEFDKMINFLQTNPAWAKKLYTAKERFIRTKEKALYSTDFFGFYDESERVGRNQIAFYYSTLFHEYCFFQYPEFNQVPEIVHFFELCAEIQKPYGKVFSDAVSELGLEEIFSSKHDHQPVLFKVIKYLPSYDAARPHYDGTALSLFLDSTDNQSLLFSPYKSSFTTADFSSPQRDSTSILLIPGGHLTEFSIYPTPHIVTKSGKERYATIAFAMRSNFTPQKVEFSSLPNFNY